MKTLVMTFGRFEIPTIGHIAHINAVKSIADAAGADYKVYVSQTKHTLPVERRIDYLKQAAGIDQIEPAPNPFVVLDQIASKRYGKVIMAFGGDYFESDQPENQLFASIKQYGLDNGVVVEVQSTGQRTSGISGTDAKAALADQNYTKFASIAAPLPESEMATLYAECIANQ